MKTYRKAYGCRSEDESMGKLLKFLKNASEVLATTSAVLAAAIVVVETYQVLRKKIDEAKRS